jgi:hypothetical protein
MISNKKLKKLGRIIEYNPEDDTYIIEYQRKGLNILAYYKIKIKNGKYYNRTWVKKNKNGTRYINIS